MKRVIYYMTILILASCNSDSIISEEESEKLFSLMDPSYTGVDFENKVVNEKDFNIFKYRNYYNGGGVAIGDINNDSLPDIYFTSNKGKNKLYLNKGNLKFDDISKSAGIEGNKPWSTGVMMVDINNDGLLDIYVSNAGIMEGDNHDNDLYINNGDLTFKESAEEYNLANTGFSTHATFLDYDKDGDLDAYILNNSNIPVTSLGYSEQRDLRAQEWENVPKIFRGVGDMLLRNDNGKFVDVSEESGIYGSLIGFGLGVMTSDINGDSYPDIYVSNDFYERDYLYINNKDGTFTEDIMNWTSHLCLSAMGIDMADINNDGLIDIFITDMLPEEDKRVKSVMEFEGYNVYKLKQSKGFYQQYIQNTLQLNNGNETFSEIAYISGVAATDWSWAGLMFDMDNDGYRDIFVTNGINHDLTDIDFVNFFADEIIQDMALTGRKQAIDSIIDKMPIKPQANYAFRNNGDLTFDNANKDWGFETKTFSNGAAYSDLDNDGDLDLVINNVNMKSFIYKNNSEKLDHNYIQFDLKGAEKNPFSIGSKIMLYAEGQKYIQELIPSRGFQSSMEYIQTIGLGNIEKIDSVRIIWPNDKTLLLKDVGVNQRLTLNINDTSNKYIGPNEDSNQTLVKELVNENMFKHSENSFSDFDYEGLIYKLLSQEGPAFATGDINLDGLDDVFIGGAKYQKSMIYLNQGESLVELPQEIFKNINGVDHTAASFFDSDGDGDLDLAVGFGGNEIQDEFRYTLKIYLNDGTGNFKESEFKGKSLKTNISVIKPADFDLDGDTDLFVGSRSVVGTFGIDPKHQILENINNELFIDSTEKIAYTLNEVGMVTDAEWTDLNSDGVLELITISDWGNINIFVNNNGFLQKTSSNIGMLNGSWEAIEVADLDNDGDQDLILGNQGDNTLYKGSLYNPMRMWINDFDNNGTIEQIMTQYYNEGNYPLHMKKELTNQIVKLKKDNLKANDYASRTIDQLFDQDILDNSIVKELNYTKTIVAENLGDFQFNIIDLPNQVQFSCVIDIETIDINGDGFLDIVMGGNNYEFKPQYSRMDSNYGTVLLNNGNMDFKWLDYTKSGFFIKDEIKHLKSLENINGDKLIIAAINNNKPKIFQINE
ncbi:MAG: VCBS repeat-containing protein [Flavobacteriaceae bacterium]